MFASLHTSTVAVGRVERRGRPGLMTRLRAAMAVTVQRRRLAALDAVQLRDIGLTHADVRAETARAPWDVPAHWLA